MSKKILFISIMLLITASTFAADIYYIDCTSGTNRDFISNDTLLIMLRSFQGMVNRDAPRLFINSERRYDTDQMWLDDMMTRYSNYNWIEVVDAWDIFLPTHPLRSYCNRIMIYSDENPEMFNATINFVNSDGVTNRMIAPDSNEAWAMTVAPYNFAYTDWTSYNDNNTQADYYMARQWSKLSYIPNISYKDEYMLNSYPYPGQTFPNGLDYCIAQKMASWALDPEEHFLDFSQYNYAEQDDTVLDMFTSNKCRAYGWWTVASEVTSVELISEYGDTFFGQGLNDSFLRWFGSGAPTPSQPEATLNTTFNQNRKYIAIFYTQGDNMSWITKHTMNYYKAPSQYYANTLISERYPFGLQIGTPTVDVSPYVRQFFDEIQTDDQLIISKGYGYNCPTTLKNHNYLGIWINQTNNFMAANGVQDLFVNDRFVVGNPNNAALDQITNDVTNLRSVFYKHDIDDDGAANSLPFKKNGVWIFHDPVFDIEDANGDFDVNLTRNAIGNDPRQFFYIFFTADVRPQHFEDLCDSIVATYGSSVQIMKPDEWIKLWDAVNKTRYDVAEDAYVKENGPDVNFGSAIELRVRAEVDKSVQSFLKFNMNNIPPGGPVSAKLRFYAIDDIDQVKVHLADNNWTESTITWNNRPSLTSDLLGQADNVQAGNWYEVDVSSVINGPGTYTFRLRTNDSRISRDMASREYSGGSYKARIMLDYGDYMN